MLAYVLLDKLNFSKHIIQLFYHKEQNYSKEAHQKN